ncbi:hypothetical protein P8605_10155, partial [Streptomyces sp. T-3]|nr:hypothetical protein [Streptomyces sp. T-3]
GGDSGGSDSGGGSDGGSDDGGGSGGGTPAGCGGDNWGAITNVGNGLKVGLADGSPRVDGKVVMGGHTEFGWVKSTDQQGQVSFRSCNLSKPELSSYSASWDSTPRTILSGSPSSLSTIWNPTKAGTSGAYYLKDFNGNNCLTDNGSGKQLTVIKCTPGSKAQQWRIP